ncbi:hypothetical protein PIB30_020853 [Stylosanthes scabra]|uniref:Transposase (Putative), gypsy type n=1 Tax=Stylosanthes scabra TaxID=79078 RepID=A0ABU6V8V1_9FABA|nr:hypothetical protein [Stylosanthes scabra]
MNASIRYSSSLIDFRWLLRMAPTLSFFFRLLTCQTVCGTSLRVLLFADVAERMVTFAHCVERESSGSGFRDAEQARFYGWVEEAVLTQPSLVESDSLLEFRRSYPLMEDSGVEGDYVLEAAGPSDRVPFRAGKDGPHFLWVYQELFTRLRMRLPFSDFQRDVITRCLVAVSQLHLNGWGFILAFEKVCLHFGFRPTIRLFFFIYDVHFPPGGYGYISFRARQGRRLFDSYEDSIQEFKWHYFKVLAAPGKQAFWLDYENKPFPWVYWNPDVKDFVVYNLEPLEMAALKFLVSLPSGLPKRSKFTCRFILDGSDAEVREFLDDLLDVKMKRTKLDDLMAKMADPARMGPWPILPTSSHSATAIAAAAAVAFASAAGTSIPAAVGSPHVESSIQVPPAPTASDAKRAKKQPSKRERARVVDSEEELKEDPAADLQSKRKRKKSKIDEAFEKALGDDAAWEHEVDPLRVAFPADFDYRKALNAGLTSAPVREALTKMPPEQLLGESYLLHAKLLACLQVGMETSLAAKIRVEKELSAALDQIEVLKGERDSALSFFPFKEKVATLEDDLSEKSLQHQSALDRIAQLEEDNKVLKAQFESSQLSLETEQKRAATAEGEVRSLTVSLKTYQTDLSKATEASEYWRSEWHALGSDVTEMCQETLDVCLDQVSHLCPGVDFSALTLKTRWDLKGRRIFVPPESEVGEEFPSAEAVVQEQGPPPAAQASQPAAGDAAGSGGECPT